MAKAPKPETDAEQGDADVQKPAAKARTETIGAQCERLRKQLAETDAAIANAEDRHAAKRVWGAVKVKLANAERVMGQYGSDWEVRAE